jgi:hypothetical protein
MDIDQSLSNIKTILSMEYGNIGMITVKPFWVFLILLTHQNTLWVPLF